MPNDEWGSPPEIIELVRKVLGGIDFDPCSNHSANKIVRAKRYCQINDKSHAANGLEVTWPDHSSVFMNAPYSRGNPAAFMNKFRKWWFMQAILDANSSACLLFNNDTETRWFQLALSVKSAYCLLNKRIHFLDANGKPSKNTRQGQALFYFGDDVELFKRVFKKMGYVE
jgi:hypothetical protein